MTTSADLVISDSTLLMYYNESRTSSLPQSTRNKNKQTNKQSSLLTLTICREKRSCLIRSKKKTTKQNKKKRLIKGN